MREEEKHMTENKLKIAMLTAHSCPVGDLGAKDTGGMSVYIRELARELGKQGHSMDVYTRVHDPADPRIEDLGRGGAAHSPQGGEGSENTENGCLLLPSRIYLQSGELLEG